ncbi:MAG: hypothetical protein ACLVES_05935, partial [Faecalibacterium prausnitzii]
QAGHIVISGKAALAAVVMAAMVFSRQPTRSRLPLWEGKRQPPFLLPLTRRPRGGHERLLHPGTLVDFCGVLILTVQHERLRRAAPAQ